LDPIKLDTPRYFHSDPQPACTNIGGNVFETVERCNDPHQQATSGKINSTVNNYPISAIKWVKFNSIPNLVPTPGEMEELYNDPDMEAGDWESKDEKQSYALAFDRFFRLHTKNHFNQHFKDPKEPWTQRVTSKKHKGARAMFIHLFGAPLFKMVAANWARLIVRRSFDLDLLEWRGKERMSSSSIEEIKSRRIAIGRHQRDIAASLEVLRGLMLEERGEISETSPEWNKGRSNGFVTQAAYEDSWSRIYFDFFELRASMDALESRANKIQDGMVGLISVWNGEQTAQSNMSASILNNMAFVFSVILLPFSIVGQIFSADLILGDPTAKRSKFLKAMFATFASILGIFVLFIFLQLYSQPEHIRPKWVSKVRESVDHCVKPAKKEPLLKLEEEEGLNGSSQKRPKNIPILRDFGV
jgi:hypothetical protein